MPPRERPTKAPLRIGESTKGDAVVLAAAGELDYASGPQLQAALEAVLARGADVVLDLRDVDFMDSTGVNVTVVAMRRAQSAGRRFSVAHGPASWRTMRLVGLAGVVPVADPLP